MVVRSVYGMTPDSHYSAKSPTVSVSGPVRVITPSASMGGPSPSLLRITRVSPPD